jgi:putative ABC transport system permease protein
MMETLWQDLRYATRSLRKHWGLTLLAVMTLALGLGANTAVFSVADGFLFKPVPLPQSERLAMLAQLDPHQTRDTSNVSPADFEDWKKQSSSFERLSAFTSDDINLTGAGTPEKVQGILVSADFFDTAGVKPILGRTFRPEETTPGRHAVVVLSQGLWQRHFAGDPEIIGRTVQLNGRSYGVVGVMGKEFDFPMTAELWLPLALEAKDKESRSAHMLLVVGRLKPDVSLPQAGAEMQTITRRISDANPQTNRGWSVRVFPIRDFVIGNLTHDYTLLLLGAVGFVLLIACANVAGLLFSRTASRQREIAVRAALGASRARLVRLLLTESLLLALLGVALAIPLAQGALQLILTSMPADVAKFIGGWKQISLDYRALVFALGIAVFSGIVSGLVPALQISRLELNKVLKEGGRSSTGSRSSHRLRGALVVCEVAMALVLIVGAGLMVKGFRALMVAHRDSHPDSLLTLRVTLTEAKYASNEQRAAFYRQALERIERLPQVQSAAVLYRMPYVDGAGRREFVVEGSPLNEAGERRTAVLQSVSPAFFSQFHVPVLDGRELSQRDMESAEGAAVISESLARQYFPGQNPVGHRINPGTAQDKKPWLTIVGVVGDIQYSFIYGQPLPTIYAPYTQAPRSFSEFAIRSSQDLGHLVPAVREQFAAVDPELPLGNIKMLDQVIYESNVGLAYVAVMMAVVGGLALVLAAAGLYGVMAYWVAERTQEFGIRMVLGALPQDVLRLVAKRGMFLTLLGVAVGLPISMLLARALSSLLFGVTATDLVTFGGVSLLLALVAMLACYVPVRRATRVDPMVALRYE